MSDTVTLAWLISRLTNMAVEHGYDTPVYIHDADTDWSMPLGDDCVRYGLDDYQDGEKDAVMIKAKGYGA